MKLKSSQRMALAPSEAETFSRFVSAMSGSGVRATAWSSLGAIAARKCRHRACERNGMSSRARAIRLRRPSGGRRNGIAAERRGDELGVGVGVEDQVDDRVGGGARVVAEGVVEEVVEDPPVQLGLGAVVAAGTAARGRSGLPRRWRGGSPSGSPGCAAPPGRGASGASGGRTSSGGGARPGGGSDRCSP